MHRRRYFDRSVGEVRAGNVDFGSLRVDDHDLGGCVSLDMLQLHRIPSGGCWSLVAGSIEDEFEALGEKYRVGIYGTKVTSINQKIKYKKQQSLYVENGRSLQEEK